MTGIQRYILKLGQRGLCVVVLAVAMVVSQAINLLVTRVADLTAFEAGALVVGTATVAVGIPIVSFLSRLVFDLDRAREEVKTLKGVVPICSACKDIRTDDGVWRQLELHLAEHTEAGFTHGICPDCARRLYPDPMCKGDTVPITAGVYQQLPPE